MIREGRVICFCPARRLALTSLVCSTWTSVGRFLLTEDEHLADDVRDFDAAIVMDGFVTERLVKKLAARVHVYVLAWNGLFELARYRKILGALPVTFLGTDHALPDIAGYAPFIDGSCSFARWRALYASKNQFRVHGGPGYRLRWLRAKVSLQRHASVALAGLNAIKRPPQFLGTLASARTRDKLAWAGTCVLDLDGVPVEKRDALTTTLASLAGVSDSDEAMRRGVALAEQLIPPPEAPVRHIQFRAANMLLRGIVLRYLLTTVREHTWFFGRDNLELELPFELYLHNLMPRRRVAFLEFGGSSSDASLYPRALHLLANEYYVLALPDLSQPSQLIEQLVDIRSQLEADSHAFFETLERRRSLLYAHLKPSLTLSQMHTRVWDDFTSKK